MKFGKLFSTIEGILLVHDFDYLTSSIKWKYEKHVYNLYKDPSYICGYYLRSPEMLSLLHSAGLDKEIVEFMVMDNQEGYTYEIKSEYDQQMYDSIAKMGYGTARKALMSSSSSRAKPHEIPTYMPTYMPTSDDNFRTNLELMNNITKGIKEEDGK